MGFQHPGECYLEALWQHREDALSQGPDLLSNGPPHGKDEVSPGGAGCSVSSHASPRSSLWWHQASTQCLPTLQGISSQTMKQGAPPDPGHIKL